MCRTHASPRGSHVEQQKCLLLNPSYRAQRDSEPSSAKRSVRTAWLVRNVAGWSKRRPDNPHTTRARTVHPVSKGKEMAWSVKDDLLFFHNRVYVPDERSVREELLKQHHDDPLAGHFGTKRTTELLSRSYYWPNMEKEVHDYIRTCAVCQRAKVPRQKPYGELKVVTSARRAPPQMVNGFYHAAAAVALFTDRSRIGRDPCTRRPLLESWPATSQHGVTGLQ